MADHDFEYEGGVQDSIHELTTEVRILSRAVGGVETKLNDIVPAIARLDERTHRLDDIEIAVWGPPNDGGGMEGELRAFKERLEAQETRCREVQQQKAVAVVQRVETRWRWRNLLYPALIAGIATIAAAALGPWLHSMLIKL